MEMLRKIIGAIFVIFVMSVEMNAVCIYDKVAKYDENTNSLAVWELEKEEEFFDDYNEELYISTIDQLDYSALYKKMQDYANSLPLKIYIVDIIKSKTNKNIVYIITCTNQGEEKDGSVSYAWDH